MPTENNTSPQKEARKAGLRYFPDSRPGIKRLKKGKGFTYLTPENEIINDQETLKRIKKIVIPPAWENVWISPIENGHLQATGIDAMRRKQYLYHKDWQALRNETKYSKLESFIEALPKLRAQIDKDLRKRSICKDRVIATAISLMEKAYIRTGNSSYTKTHGSFGLTTLRDRHVEITGQTIRVCFKGKKGVFQDVEVYDRRLARAVKQCRDVPGYTLFQYYNETGSKDTIDSGDINEYIQAHAGEEFSAKDFRTWAGSLLAFEACIDLCCEEVENKKKALVEVTKHVSRKLGNTVSVCRQYYIHPGIFQAYQEETLKTFIEAHKSGITSAAWLSEEEQLMKLFLSRLDELSKKD